MMEVLDSGVTNIFSPRVYSFSRMSVSNKYIPCPFSVPIFCPRACSYCPRHGNDALNNCEERERTAVN